MWLAESSPFRHLLARSNQGALDYPADNAAQRAKEREEKMNGKEKKEISRKSVNHHGALVQARGGHQARITTSAKMVRSSGRARPGQRGKVRVLIPAGHQDRAALLKAGWEWLVPLLVRDFLRERGLESVSGTDSTKRNQVSYGMPWQGARATTRG